MTDHMGHEGSAGKTWLVVFLLLLIIGFQGALSYFLVGDRGQPDWDLRPVKDVPGESPYAMYDFLPFPQHVLGDEADYPPLVRRSANPYADYGETQPGRDDEAATLQLAPGWDKSMFPEPQQNAIGGR